MHTKPALLMLVCSAAASTLPAPVQLELKRLEEGYRVLDFAAPKVWNGWNGYRRVPFLLEFENGLRVLVGHPDPPKPFQPVPEAKVEDRAVFADLSAISSKPLVGPLGAGGGPIPFGADSSGKPVQVVQLRYRPLTPTEGGPALSNLTERQVLIFIHELFHCFQRESLRGRMYGNLRYNPDANYAIFSEIEGLALARAYAEPDPARARDCLRDFLAARRKKRAGSMTSLQGNQENWEEFNEGTATYSELRTLELIRAGGYQGPFTATDALLAGYAEGLQQTAARTEDPRSKSYHYGCFQAVLLQRLFPGWQESVPRDVESLHAEIARRLAVSDEDWPKLEKRLEDTYPFAEIRSRHAPVIAARDDTWRKFRSRTGRIYIIDCKKAGEYLGVLKARPKPQQLGLVTMYPEGFETYSFDDVEIGAVAGPAEVDQLYYIRIVDPEPRPYRVEGARQPDGTWKQATVHAPLFTLKAPHLRVLEAGSLVKFQVLARVN